MTSKLLELAHLQNSSPFRIRRHALAVMAFLSPTAISILVAAMLGLCVSSASASEEMD